MNRDAVTFLVVASGLGSFLLGSRAQPREGVPLAAALVAPPVATAPMSEPASQPTVSVDCQTARSQLAICMAFHPTSDDKDVQLAMCRGDLDLYKNKPTWPDCYAFLDMASVYDRELGEAEPSPETLERAKGVTLDACVQILTWADRAARQQRSCLKGDTPPGFKEQYGGAMIDRPLVKACRGFGGPTLFNASQARDEARAREMGRQLALRIRMKPDGGFEPLGMAGVRREVDADGGVRLYPELGADGEPVPLFGRRRVDPVDP